MSNITDAFDPHQWVWGTRDQAPRLLHTMLRVKDFDAALRFYIDGLGMKILDRFEVAARRASLVFIGFNDYAGGGCVELVHYWGDTEPYTHGTGYGHIAIGVPDMDGMIAKLEAMGVQVTTRPVVLNRGGPQVAFVKDPDGYDVELIQTRTNSA